MSRPVGILNCFDMPPGWSWIAGSYDGDAALAWQHVSTHRGKLLARLPGPHLGRIRAGLQARLALMRQPIDLVVSHGPRTSYYIERIANPRPSHLAWSFNFTDLPHGRQLKEMRRAFLGIERFIVFSEAERTLYARVFDLPIERFHFVHWGVSAPIQTPVARLMPQPYVAALGGEARDYTTLCEAARRLPNVQFVFVVRPHNLDGLVVPDNVTVLVNLPRSEAWSIVWHAELALVSLRDGHTPNGHVTLVGGMHLGKAQVVTDSTGVADYLKDEETALLVPPQDPAAFAQAIERLLDDPTLRGRIGKAAQAFAGHHCTDEATIRAFRDQVRELVPA